MKLLFILRLTGLIVFVSGCLAVSCTAVPPRSGSLVGPENLIPTLPEPAAVIPAESTPTLAPPVPTPVVSPQAPTVTRPALALRSTAEDDLALELLTRHETAGCPLGCRAHRPGCDIKGNISYNSGNKIYHLPGSEFYEDTIINPDFGERWFCTEDEAAANGWRPPRRYK